MARLIWRRQGGAGKSFAVEDQAVVGRDARTDCVLDAKSVSRRHARIERRDVAFYITDLGSTNGTRLNGSPLEGTARLGAGDLIQLGEEVLEFEDEAGAASGVTRGSLVTEPLSHGAPSPQAGKPEAARADATRKNGVFPRREGKFYLLQPLGHGGMGTVYHAIDLDSNREVAVKFIRSKLGRNDAFLDFFHNREAVLAREIDHANVIRVFEHGVDATQHFISMEYVPGRNLYQVLKEGPLPVDEALEILRQVACGLAAAHRQGVVHSDIKPANILLVSGDEKPAGESEGTASTARPEEDPGGILEFSDDVTVVGKREGKYDAGLVEEIRRRVGEPSRDVLEEPPFFPRASEARFLAHYFEHVLEGRGYFILVEGEAGTGKDRLISEFLEEIRTASTAPGLRVHELDCSRIEGIPLLHEQVTGRKLGGKLTLRHLNEEIVGQLAACEDPVVLRVLNLESATPLVCDLIAAAGVLLREKKLLIIAALSSEAARNNATLSSFLARMAPHTKELYLRPLTEYQIQRYLQQMFRDSLTGLSLAPDLYRLSGGNFAKLLEILRGFFERGVLSLDQPSGRLLYRPRAQEFELEEGKNLYEKFKAFGKVEQRVLEQAAFIGPRFLFDTLLKLRIHDVNETSLFFILRTFLAEGFFVEESRSWYGFTNVAFQRYIAERTPASERPHLHRKISRILQNVPVGDSAELLQLRAHHLEGCHEYARAVQSLLEGAHLARNEYRVDLCREMFQEILRIYRLLARRELERREVTTILREWFRRDGNWYEILGELGGYVPVARVKIADFGISFRMKDEERGYQVEKRPVLGTPRYMAPERGKGEYGGFKSDIFALGIIFHEMIAGSPPFPDLKGNDVIEANREREIALPDEVAQRIPQGLVALHKGMTEKDPLRRWEAERVIREVVKLQFDAKLEGGR